MKKLVTHWKMPNKKIACGAKNPAMFGDSVHLKNYAKNVCAKCMEKLSKESEPVSECTAKKNLAYTLGYTNLGRPLKNLLENAKQGAERYVIGFPACSDLDFQEYHGWLKPSYFKEIKLPLPKLKLYVKKVWDDIYKFMEKNKLW
jgi:hypothetical protein